MFEDFTITTSGAAIHGMKGGSGSPVLLLHGIPETRLMWHKVAPALAERFTVVATDLRGYGASGKPPSTPDHAPYRMRALAQDQVEVMAALGFDRFAVAGHDRGARCAYRLALDHPAAVSHLAVMDIVPIADAHARATLVLWGGEGAVARMYDPLAIWRAWATDVRGAAVKAGHFLPEEAPEETLRHLLELLSRRPR